MTLRWIRPVLLGSAVALSGAAYWHSAAAASSTAPAPVAQPIPLAAKVSKPIDPQLEASLDALDASEAPELPVPSRLQAPPLADAKAIPAAQDLLAHAHRDPLGRYLVPGKNGDQALTLDADLQDKLTQLLANYQTPYGAVVVLEPSTGRVLAMAEHSSADAKLRGLTTQALFPAASVFKIVTASALLEKGVSPEEEECFHGGKRRIQKALLQDSGRDRRCLTLTEALAHSANVVFAKETHKHLSSNELLAAAEAFHFNRLFSFPVPTDISLAAVPDDELGLASTGAGFGDVFLSPLHGAMLASVIANRGLWRAPVLFEKDVPETASTERVLPTSVAEQVGAMMAETVRSGTARRLFHQRGFAIPDAAGKTGSLADKRPVFRDYSWFVGYAPKVNPRVAVAAIVVNGYRWRIKGTYVAREAIRLALEGSKRVALSR